MSNEVEEYLNPENEVFQKVIELIIRGKRPSEIQHETGLPARVQEMIYQGFTNYANNDFEMQRRAKAVIAELDAQYNYLVRQYEDVIDHAEIEEDWKLKKDTLDSMAKANKMRSDQLQKAGVLSSEAVGEEIAITRARHEKIGELLKRVAAECKNDPKLLHIKRMLTDGIAEIYGEVVEVRDVQ